MKQPYIHFPEGTSEEGFRQFLIKYYKDGAFEFELDKDEFTNLEGNTVYHIVPHYADESAEDVIAKLRRVMEGEFREEK